MEVCVRIIDFALKGHIFARRTVPGFIHADVQGAFRTVDKLIGFTFLYIIRRYDGHVSLQVNHVVFATTHINADALYGHVRIPGHRKGSPVIIVDIDSLGIIFLCGTVSAFLCRRNAISIFLALHGKVPVNL